MSKIQQFVSVVVYIHNDADKIEKFIDTVTEVFEVFSQCEIIFVDDYSEDNSEIIIKSYFEKTPTNFIVNIIRLGKYHGMEIAMNAGRDMSIGDYVYEFDSLFIDYDKSVILEAYRKCLEGNDIVTVSTDVPLRLTSRLFYKMFNRTAHTVSKIGPESFRLLSRRGINRIISMDVDIPYRKVVYLNSGLQSAKLMYQSTVGERPPRIVGRNERIDLAFDSFIYFTKSVQHISVAIAAFFGLFAFGAILYTFISRALGFHVGLGWVSMMVLLALGLTGLFGLLAFVIRYLSVLIDLVFKRKKYLIADVEKISSKRA